MTLLLWKSIRTLYPNIHYLSQTFHIFLFLFFQKTVNLIISFFLFLQLFFYHLKPKLNLQNFCSLIQWKQATLDIVIISIQFLAQGKQLSQRPFGIVCISNIQCNIDHQVVRLEKYFKLGIIAKLLKKLIYQIFNLYQSLIQKLLRLFLSILFKAFNPK